jgi:Iron-containing alcohol dehydrogenase
MERVIFGWPCAQVVQEEAALIGATRVLLVVSRTLNTVTDEIEKIRTALGERYAGTFDGLSQHSSRSDVVKAARLGLELKANLVVAVGGGSVVDAPASNGWSTGSWRRRTKSSDSAWGRCSRARRNASPSRSEQPRHPHDLRRGPPWAALSFGRRAPRITQPANSGP